MQVDHRGLSHQIARRLVTNGVLTSRRTFRGRRYPMASGDAEYATRQDLREVLTEQRRAAPREVVLVTLIAGLEMTERVVSSMTPTEVKAAARRVAYVCPVTEAWERTSDEGPHSTLRTVADVAFSPVELLGSVATLVDL